MDKEMMRALEADGEKLRALTGEDHGPHFPAEILAEHSPHWRSLLTGKPLVGRCYRCKLPDKQLKETCGSWGLIEWLCDECR